MKKSHENFDYVIERTFNMRFTLLTEFLRERGGGGEHTHTGEGEGERILVGSMSSTEPELGLDLTIMT